MKNPKRTGFTALVTTFVFLSLAAGCATQQYRTPEVTAGPEWKGALFQIGEVRAGTFETAEYLPTRIRFWVEQELEGKGLLATGSRPEKTLSVNMVVSGYYPYFAPASSPCLSCYRDLTSRVEVIDPQTGERVARTEVTTYNPWREVTADHAETSNAEQIVDFLEGISR